MRPPTLKEFLTYSVGQAETYAWLITYREGSIREWAVGMKPTEGQLPGASARGFAEWLSNGWSDWAGDPETPVPEVLRKAVTEWCGGRSF